MKSLIRPQISIARTEGFLCGGILIFFVVGTKLILASLRGMKICPICWLTTRWWIWLGVAAIFTLWPAFEAVHLTARESKGQVGPMKEMNTPPPAMNEAEVEEAAWREKLTPEQYRILRQSGTERPFGEVYAQFKAQGAGDYYCAGCGSHLFSSDQKFDSHCGWPSFYDPASLDSVETKMDDSLGMMRIEVVCAKCGGHLGHRFDGEGFETPTDQRYCINGNVLVFVPEGEEPPKGKE